jgi:CysZ protein
MAGTLEREPAAGDPGRGDGLLARARDGLLLLPEGAALLRRERRLWLLALVPVAVTTLAIAAAVSLFWLRLDVIHAAWVSALPVLSAGEWWTWIWVGPGRVLLWLVGWLGVLVAFALSLVVALLVANLLASPFLDQLSQRVEAILTGTAAGSQGASGLLAETLRAFGAELARLAFFAAVWIVLTGVGFLVPGAHAITGPLVVVVTILLLPLDYAGFALDRRQVAFRGRRAWLLSNWPTMLGFGGTAFLACLVPGLNLLILPALVTAGTILVVRRAPHPDGVAPRPG